MTSGFGQLPSSQSFRPEQKGSAGQEIGQAKSGRNRPACAGFVDLAERRPLFSPLHFQSPHLNQCSAPVDIAQSLDVFARHP